MLNVRKVAILCFSYRDVSSVNGFLLLIVVYGERSFAFVSAMPLDKEKCLDF